MPKKLAIDAPAPDFALPATGNRTWSLKEARGRNLVLYFYPRDNTAGCTKEGEAFRDLYAAFKKSGAEIVGISTDSVASHEKFKSKFELPFELLADETQKVCKLYDVFKEKSMYGKKYMGVERSTFLIDSDGVLRREWRKVKVPQHAEEVLLVAKQL